MPLGIVSESDSCSTSRFWNSFLEAMGTRLSMSATSQLTSDINKSEGETVARKWSEFVLALRHGGGDVEM